MTKQKTSKIQLLKYLVLLQRYKKFQHINKCQIQIDLFEI